MSSKKVELQSVETQASEDAKAAAFAELQAKSKELKEQQAAIEAELRKAKQERAKIGQAFLAEAVKQHHAAIKQIEEICDTYGLTCDLEITYGMGGTYFGIGNGQEWSASSEGTWQSSSSMC